MQLQHLSVWREQMVKALNQPRSFILRNSTMIDLVEKNPRNNFQLASIKDIRAGVVREYGKVILDLLKFCLKQKSGHYVWLVPSNRPQKLLPSR